MAIELGMLPMELAKRGTPRDLELYLGLRNLNLKEQKRQALREKNRSRNRR